MTHEMFERFLTVDTTAICDADKSIRVMDQGIKFRSAQNRVLGPAFTVRCRGDLLGVLQAIETASPGDVIVVDGGQEELAFAGELFTRGALVRNLGGIIVDGGYRDIGYVSSSQIPVFSRFITPHAGTNVVLGELQIPIMCGGVPVNPGDTILADEEGIVVADSRTVSDILDTAAKIKAVEKNLIQKLESGATLSEGFNVAEHIAALTRGETSSLKFIS